MRGSGSRFHDGQRIAAAILGDGACAREREVIAADHDLVGDHPVEQLAARSLGESGVLSNALIGISLVTILSASGEGHALRTLRKNSLGGT